MRPDGNWRGRALWALQREVALAAECSAVRSEVRYEGIRHIATQAEALDAVTRMERDAGSLPEATWTVGNWTSLGDHGLAS